MSISIIIVTYNNQYQIKTCINSIVEEIHQIEGEIIIIDNNSTETLDPTLLFNNKQNKIIVILINFVMLSSQH